MNLQIVSNAKNITEAQRRQHKTTFVFYIFVFYILYFCVLYFVFLCFIFCISYILYFIFLCNYNVLGRGILGLYRHLVIQIVIFNNHVKT
jgi:uncharacterized membrane protein